MLLATPARAQMTETELVTRLNRLENMVRQLTGQVEQLQYRNDQLEQQLRGASSSSSSRLRRSARRSSSTRHRSRSNRLTRSTAQRATYPQQQYQQPNVMQQDVEPAPPARGGRRGDAFDPYQNPNAPGVPRTLGRPGTVAAAPPLDDTQTDEPPYVGAPGGRQAGAPLDLGIMAEEAANAPPPRREVRKIPGALPAPPPRNTSAPASRW